MLIWVVSSFNLVANSKQMIYYLKYEQIIQATGACIEIQELQKQIAIQVCALQRQN